MNEINITVLDALLLAWVVIATVQALKYRTDARQHIHLLNRLLADDDLHERIVSDYKRLFGNK